MIKKLMAGLLLGVVVLLAAPALPALASPAPALSASGPAVQQVANVLGPVAQQTDEPPPGPRIDPAETERANAEKSKSKLIVGAIAAVLAAIVVWGHYTRYKRRKANS